MKKRIFAVLLAMAVMLSMAMFVSCNGGGDDEDLGEEVSIKATVKIVALDGYVLVPDLLVTMTGYAKEQTVLKATKQALAAAELEYVEEDGFIQSIGTYGVEEYHLDDDDEDDDDGDEVDHFWVYMLNGRDAPGPAWNTMVNEGDFIEWIFTEEIWE